MLSIFLLVTLLSLLLQPAPFFITNNALAQTPAKDSSSFLTYINPTYQIKIQYPNDWIKLEGGLVGEIKENNAQNIVLFFSPDCSVGILIAMENLAKKTTLNEYISAHIEELRKNEPGMHIIELKNITLSGLPAYRITAGGLVNPEAGAKRLNIPDILGNTITPPRPFNATSMDNIVLHDDQAYVVGYTDSSGKTLGHFSNQTSNFIGHSTI